MKSIKLKLYDFWALMNKKAINFGVFFPPPGEIGKTKLSWIAHIVKKLDNDLARESLKIAFDRNGWCGRD